MSGSYGEELLRAALAGTDPNASPVTHTEVIPAAQARYGQWPRWLDPAIVAAYAELGLHRPWQHQVVAAEHAFAQGLLGQGLDTFDEGITRIDIDAGITVGEGGVLGHGRKTRQMRSKSAG